MVLHSDGSNAPNSCARVQIFLGGLPYHFDEALCRQLLEPFGELQSFELVRDREKGDSKGYGFAVYNDRSVTETAIVGLNGLNIEGRVLTCRKCAHLVFLLRAPQGCAGCVWVYDMSRSGLTNMLCAAHCAVHIKEARGADCCQVASRLALYCACCIPAQHTP